MQQVQFHFLKKKERNYNFNVITCHVAGPLVALEVELPSGLSDVLSRLLLLDLLDLLLGILTKKVHS